jgi:NitT/TauT family transport system substrate-binding protein
MQARTGESLNRTSRRQLLKGAAGLGLSVAGGALLGGCANQVAPFFSRTSGDQLETTRIRLSQIAGICVSPEYVANDFLKAEGFTDVEYVEIGGPTGVGTGRIDQVDVGMNFAAPFIVEVDRGTPMVLLGGIHIGCFELFGIDSVRTIRDLKGMRVGVPGIGTAHHAFLSSMAAYVGLDPREDITWVSHHPSESAQMLTDGKVDALVGFPPIPQELRAKKIGHVVVNSAVDRPWSQYFCCFLAVHREFAQQYPVATKRALRAVLKATDLCASDPERAARTVVERGFTKEYDFAVQTFKELPYDRWRDYDPEDTIRFYALRLHEIGMIKSTPDQIIKQGTDWRFFNGLKQELKG